jgi:uncharacterized protein involved in cysteine biosynthesis
MTETFTLSTLIISLIVNVILVIAIMWIIENDVIRTIIRKIRKEPKAVPAFDAYYLEMSYLKEMEEKEREAREE